MNSFLATSLLTHRLYFTDAVLNYLIFAVLWISIVLMPIRIQHFILMRIRIYLSVCDNWSIDPLGLHFEPSGLYSERPQIYFEPLKLSNYSNADTDPDPAFKK